MSILSMSLQAGVMIFVVTAIRALLINLLPKKTFLALWGIVLLRLLIPFSMPSPFSVYSLANCTDLPFPTVPAAVANFPPITMLPQNSVDIAKPVISIWMLIWGIGATLCALYFIVVYLRGHREFAISQPVNNTFVSSWLKAHPLNRPIKIRQSSGISAPLTYGVFRPIILMPQQADWNDTPKMQYVLTHEYIHIYRFDAAIKILFVLSLCLHWFNPMVWAMFILANRDIELSCDEAVVRSLGETIKSAYALALISMEEQKSIATPFCNSFGKHAIEERIKAIMKYKKMTAITFLIATILVTGVTTGFATSAVASNESPATNTTIPKDNLIPPVTLNQPLEQTEKLLENYGEYSTLGITYNNENGRFYFNGELVRYFEDKALNRYFGAYADGQDNVYAVRNADGLLTGFEVLNLENDALDIKYREYTDFGLKFQKTDSNGLELYGKPISAFHDVAVGVGISRKNGGDGVEYQAVRDTLDLGPTGQGRLIDIKPKDEM